MSQPPPQPQQQHAPPLPPPPPPPPPLPPGEPPATSAMGGTGTMEVLDLSAESLAARAEQESLLLDLEAKKRAFSVVVPTLSRDVRDALRNLGEPVRLFGEDAAAIRDRLRMILARNEVLEERGGVLPSAAAGMGAVKRGDEAVAGEVKTRYTHASDELLLARRRIAAYSLETSRRRLVDERRRRIARAELTSSSSSSPSVDATANDEKKEDEAMVECKSMDRAASALYRTVRNMGLDGSQFGGENRPLSCISADYSTGVVATGGWSGGIKLWDSRGDIELLGNKVNAHLDRIMGIAVRPPRSPQSSQSDGGGGGDAMEVDDGDGGGGMLATTSIDLAAKVWRFRRSPSSSPSPPGAGGGTEAREEELPYALEEVAHLRGHQARLCRVAWHPLGSHVATTSFDHTWRLWDVETGKELLLQDGHDRETYGVAMHRPDGSLCCTTDFGGVVQLWDLRTGKSVCHFLGHAKRVLAADFSPTGFQLATAGDDGTVKVWDLRRRRQVASVPAHSKLIPQVRFSYPSGDALVSCSFDGTAKVWNARRWGEMMVCLEGHEGKVMGVDVLEGFPSASSSGGGGGGEMGVGHGNVVTCGYDKTVKLWS